MSQASFEPEKINVAELWFLALAPICFLLLIVLSFGDNDFGPQRLRPALKALSHLSLLLPFTFAMTGIDIAYHQRLVLRSIRAKADWRVSQQHLDEGILGAHHRFLFYARLVRRSVRQRSDGGRALAGYSAVSLRTFAESGAKRCKAMSHPGKQSGYRCLPGASDPFSRLFPLFEYLFFLRGCERQPLFCGCQLPLRRQFDATPCRACLISNGVSEAYNLSSIFFRAQGPKAACALARRQENRAISVIPGTAGRG